MDLGTLADWANAAGTLTATGAAIFAGTVAYRAYQRERANDRQRHASGVHAWLAWDTTQSSDGQRIILMNSGVSLIYDLSVQLMLNGEESIAPSRSGGWQVLPPGLYVVGPHETYRWAFPEAASDPTRYRPYTRSAVHRVIGVDFTDAGGTTWHRDARGQLTERASSVDEHERPVDVGSTVPARPGRRRR